MITADTITDDDLHNVRGEVLRLVATAMGEDGLPANHLLVRAAKEKLARCAEILAARQAGAK